MVPLLVSLLFLALVISVVIYIIRLFPIPAPFGNIIIAVLLVFVLVWLLRELGPGLSLGIHSRF